MADNTQFVARNVVYDYVRSHLDNSDELTTVSPENIYVVWFCYILGGWKCLLSTDLLDGMYYEVTYNKDKKEVYLDAYKKFHNVEIPLT